MKARCLRETHKRYNEWGGRGITLCDEWMKFENFLKDMGEPPQNTSIDRIDNDKGYYKENCRWATNIQQARNKSNKRILTANGKSQSVAEWCEELGIKREMVNNRLIRGYSDHDALYKEFVKKRSLKGKFVTRTCICGKEKIFKAENYYHNKVSKYCVSCRMKIVRSKVNKIENNPLDLSLNLKQ
jgi:hypothetical protein